MPGPHDDHHELERMTRANFSAVVDKSDEGARPSSLIPVHKLSTPDRLHDLNLLRMTQVANERTVRNLGPLPLDGVPVQKRRKPNLSLPDAQEPAPTSLENEEDGTMKLTHMTAMAALLVGTTACNPTTATGANTNAASANPVPQVPTAIAPSSAATVAVASTTHAPAKASAPTLGPEYKKIDTFIDFRKKLLADGWQPVVNPDCHALLGVDEYCSIIPETSWASGTGYYVLHYIKDGTPLSVTLYGEIESLNKPDTSGPIWVTGWEYTTSVDDFIPEETDPTYNPAFASPSKQPMVAREKELTIRELSVVAGVDCQDVEKGADCTTGNYEVGDYYDVKLSPNCGHDGLFAAVKNKKGAELLDRAPPKDTISLATLSEGAIGMYTSYCAHQRHPKLVLRHCCARREFRRLLWNAALRDVWQSRSEVACEKRWHHVSI
jgi:hypothetical protein